MSGARTPAGAEARKSPSKCERQLSRSPTWRPEYRGSFARGDGNRELVSKRLLPVCDLALRAKLNSADVFEAGLIELTIDRLADGEVSPYLTDQLSVGDQLEMRGPIGPYFVWRGQTPLLLVGGGSGVVPLMAMLRHWRALAPPSTARLIYSVRGPEDVIYADEFGVETTLTYTRVAPEGWSGPTGRVSREMLAPIVLSEGPAFVCGSHGFVEVAAEILLGLGYAPQRILTERFGPGGS